MKIQWDPYTGQFIDIGTVPSAPPPQPQSPLTHNAHHTIKGDDEPIVEIGVPPRNNNAGAGAGSKPTGLKPEELKVGGGSAAKANAYLAQKMVGDSCSRGLLVGLDGWVVVGHGALWRFIKQIHRPDFQNTLG